MRYLFSPFQKLFLTVISAILIQAGVSPHPILRLKPASDNTTWLFGKEYSSIAVENIKVAIAFDRAYRDYIVFDVEISNLSDELFLVSPEKFLCTPLISLTDSLDEQKLYAVDPETKLLEIDKGLSKENADYASEVIVDATVSILALFADIASDDEDGTDDYYAEAQLGRLERNANHSRQVTNLNILRDKWEFNTLRKTHLQPEYEIQGKIYFPVITDARFLKINLPIAGRVIKFFFEQTVHNVN